MTATVVAIDQGTSATKACAFRGLELVGSYRVPVGIQYPGEGRAEQDPEELVESIETAVEAVVRVTGIDPGTVDAFALSNQGESFLVWDKSGTPLSPVIGWQDRRGAEVLPGLGIDAFRYEELTGLPLGSEFVAPKLAAVLRDLVERPAGAGTTDAYFARRFSGIACSDRATSSRTGLVRSARASWDDELCNWFGIPIDVLPEIYDCDSIGPVMRIAGIEAPLCGATYDVGAALLGQACMHTSAIKVSFGTALGTMICTGRSPVHVEGLIRTVPFTFQGLWWALDGEGSAAGALISWLESLGLGWPGGTLDTASRNGKSWSGPTVVPALSGLGAPWWDDGANGMIVGLRTETNPADIARAAYEAIGWSIRAALGALPPNMPALTSIRACGGLAASDVLMQICADATGIPVEVAAYPEASARGVAMLALASLGELGEAGVVGSWRSARTYTPCAFTDAMAGSWERFRGAVNWARAARGAQEE